MNKPSLYNLTLYSSALCNLKCKYCFIHKSPLLQEMEKLIEQYCNSDYYFDFLDRLSPYFSYDGLKNISYWGGEPSIGFKRFANVTMDFMKKYKTIDTLKFSSNFTYKDLIPSFVALLDAGSSVKDEFVFDAQVSVDGPPFINDSNRGFGTTDLIIENFSEMLGLCEEYPNVNFISHPKGTLSLEQVEYLLNGNNLKIFFDFFYNIFVDCQSRYKNLRCGYPHVNIAVPGRFTKEDGILFAEYARKCNELQNTDRFRNKGHLFFLQSRVKERFLKCDISSYKEFCGFCGLGRGDIGLLPEWKVSLCHRTFADIVKSYKEEAASSSSSLLDNRIFSAKKFDQSIIFDVKDAEKHLGVYRDYLNIDSTSIMITNANLIRSLAFVGQVNERYKTEDGALFGAKLLLHTFGLCAKDCQDLTGTLSSSYAGAARLLLNGADEVMLKGTRYEI